MRASAGLLILLWAVSGAAAPRVRVGGGELEGVTVAGGQVQAFLGIPYAAPPVGPRRWQPPAPAPAWRGVRSAAAFGPRCPQTQVYSDTVFRDAGPSEDCLTLNVWTPAGRAGPRLPVLVWIHGGGLVAGGGSEPRQDGAALARRGAVVVSFNYRLGILGFFSHPELDAEAPGRPSGNQGLRDQLEALRWVQRNIAAFGGDPTRVTVFGESAGAMSVSVLMASRLSAGLFHRAIGESGAYLGKRGELSTHAAAAAAQPEALRAETGTAGLAALRALPAQALVERSIKAILEERLPFGPTVDGDLVPEQLPLTFARGAQQRVPLLAGWNADEGYPEEFFEREPPSAAAYQARARQRFGAQADEVLRLYPGTTDAEALRSAIDFSGDAFLGHATWAWLDAHRATGGVPVFRYRFEQVPPGLDGGVDPGGASHAAEIPYVFDTLDSEARPWRPEDRRLAAAMADAWVSFARSGVPASTGLPRWPQDSADGGAVMHLSAQPLVTPETDRERYRFLDRLWAPGR